MTKEQILQIKDIEAQIAELKAKADAIKDEIKAGLLGEKRRKAYESKINQLKIMYPVDMLTI